MTQLPFTATTCRVTAAFSPCRTHRYRLAYRWAPGPTWAWTMLNPSIAGAGQTADDLDPTLRRCVGFAKAGGAGAITVTNLSPFVGTNRADLWAALDRGEDVWQDPRNTGAIVAAALEAHRSGGLLVCGWGAFSKANNTQWRAAAFHSERVLDAVRLRGISPQALALTKGGNPRQPRHPLYLKKSLVPQPLAMMRRGLA